MKNPVIHCFVVALVILLSINSSMAQSKGPTLTKDTTPIDQLEYRLSQLEFQHYYGIDDTSRAIINMFFRKRTNSIVNFCAPGTACLALTLVSGGGLIFVSYSFGIPVFVVLLGAGVAYMIKGLVQRITYSRKALLYALVDRERGYPLPLEYQSKLKSADFSR
jgi:hypothetical protein